MSEVLSSNRLITQIYQALNWILQSCWALCYWYPYKALYTTLFTVKGHNKQYQLYRLIDKLLRWPTINIFCRLLGNIVIKIYVENTCSAVDYLARPTKLLWGTGGTDGDTAFDFIDVIREWEGKRNCTDVGDGVLRQVLLKELWPCQPKGVSACGLLKTDWPCL